jgi:hypothetical protein
MAENEALYVPDRGAGVGSAGGLGTLYVVGNADSGLSLLATNFPAAFGRALGRVGSDLRQAIRAALESGGPSGETWKQVSGWSPWSVRAKPNRRRKGARRRPSRYNGSSLRSLQDRFFRHAVDRPYGKLFGAARYLLDKGQLSVQVGWVTPTAAAYGRDVQAAMRGASPYDPTFSGSQPVTRSMRRALAAMGVILSKSTTSLTQPERPLMRTMFEEFEPKIPGIIEEAMERYLDVGGAQ